MKNAHSNQALKQEQSSALQKSVWQSFLLGICFAILGGLAAFIAAPSNNNWPFAFFAVSAFGLITLYNCPLRAGVLGFIWAFTYFFALFDWISISAGTVIARIALAFVLSLYFMLIAWIWAALFTPYRNAFFYSKNANLDFHQVFWSILLAAFIWIGVEQLRMIFPFGGMPWGNLAFSLTDSPLLKLARFGSTGLIQLFALIIGLSLAFAWFSLQQKRLFTAVTLVFICMLCVVLPFTIPNLKLNGAHLQTLIVQGNAPESFAGYLGGKRALEITHNHVNITNQKYTPEIDLIIWPESASDRDIRVDHDAAKAFAETSSLIGETPILLGTQEYFANGTRTNDYLLYRKGQIVGKYSKQHPVPFGEFVPWRDTLGKYFTQIEQIASDMIPGKNPARIEIELKHPIFNVEHDTSPITRVVAGTPICFEVAFDDIVNQAALGSDFLVFPTNNSSFGWSQQAAQQFEMARLRAVEHGKTVIQAATSGITGVIDANGVVAYRTDLFTQDARIEAIELRDSQSFANQTYDYRVYTLYFAALFACIIAFLRYVRNA